MLKANEADEKKVFQRFEKLSKSISSLEAKVTKLTNVLEKIERAKISEQMMQNRAKIEHHAEQSEQTEQQNEQLLDRAGQTGEIAKGANDLGMQKIRGRNRELLTLLINEGFHTYAEISKKMNISESRARAYITELKGNFNVPIKQVRDPEGYKIGIDISFVDRILSAAK
jgi:DNA-binding CsgD family transcriptional regulator